MGEREGIFALGCGRSRLDSVAVALWHLQAQDVVVWRKGWDPNSRWAREREIWRGRVLGARPDLVLVSGLAFSFVCFWKWKSEPSFFYTKREANMEQVIYLSTLCQKHGPFSFCPKWILLVIRARLKICVLIGT